MPRSPKPRRSPAAVVIAFLALFLALGGTAVGAKLITGKQVKDASLTGRDIKNGSVQAADLAAGAVAERAAGAVGAPGPAGPKGDGGPAGAVGATGPAGPVGPAGKDGKDGKDGEDGEDGQDGATGPAGPVALTYHTVNKTVTSGDSDTYTACPAGMSALGGGTKQDVNSSYVVLQQGPADGDDADFIADDGWHVRVRNANQNIVGLVVVVVCTTPTSVG